MTRRILLLSTLLICACRGGSCRPKEPVPACDPPDTECVDVVDPQVKGR